MERWAQLGRSPARSTRDKRYAMKAGIARRKGFPDGAGMLRLVTFLFLSVSTLWAATADQDWEQMIALDAGPGLVPKTAGEALQISLTHLDRQETALRGFLQAHPNDPRTFH